MALQWNIPSLDELAPEVAALYKADEVRGGYTLDVTEPDAIRKALVAERDARGQAERAAARAEAKRQTDTATLQAERDAALATAQSMRHSLLDLHVRRAAQSAGLHTAAVADALRAAREAFDVADDGTIKPRSGKLSLDDWLAKAKEEAPHWFPATGSGSGASASVRTGGRVPGTISRRDFDALPPAQRTVLMRQGGVTVVD
jgi:hypothetical protein